MKLLLTRFDRRAAYSLRCRFSQKVGFSSPHSAPNLAAVNPFQSNVLR